MVKIGILGCGGRMGRMLLVETLDHPEAELAGGVDVAPGIAGQDLGLLAGRDSIGLAASGDVAALAAVSDVVIDFTLPHATIASTPIVAAAGKPIVIGTTALGDAGNAVLAAAAQQVAVVWAANFSLAVNLLLGLTEQVARTLGPDYDIEILEMHHRTKIDAPSGTALAFGRAAAAGRGAALEDLWVKTRDGVTGPRTSGTIGFATLRGGDVAGDHSVIFAAAGERLELVHKASDRRVFARGAIRAALWAASNGTGEKAPGLYGMREVLGVN